MNVRDITRYDLVKYYSHHFTTNGLEQIIEKSHLETREFAFKYSSSSKSLNRPICFKTLDELAKYLGVEGPNKAYLGGFYNRRFPDDKKLQARVRENEWAGRELCFDIDMDHYINVRKNLCQCGEKKSICDICLTLAKEAVQFAIETLVEDFAIPRNEMVVVFSGRQGFHLWAKSKTKFFKNEQNFPPKITNMIEVDMRTALAEYLQLITEKVREKKITNEKGEKVKIKEHILSVNYDEIPKPLENRVYNIVFKNLILQSPDETLNELIQNHKKIKFPKVLEIKQMMSEDKDNPNIGKIGFMELIKPYSLQPQIKELVKKIVELRYPRYDIGCTKDIHRIMKIPNGIDGSTGNKCIIVEDLETFSLKDVPNIKDFIH